MQRHAPSTAGVTAVMLEVMIRDYRGPPGGAGPVPQDASDHGAPADRHPPARRPAGTGTRQPRPPPRPPRALPRAPPAAPHPRSEQYPMAAPKPDATLTRNGGDLGCEADLFKAADKLRGNMEPSDYKHVALRLIFLKHISDGFEAKHAALLADYPEGAEDPAEYTAENVFWVPKEARWSQLKVTAKQPGIGKRIDEAMLAIEKVNPSLKGVLTKEYARPALDAVMLGELIDLISGIALGESGDRARDVLGRVYEYFLTQFAGSEGKRGGEFYTPRSVVRVLVELLEPFPDSIRKVRGRVYDPCCGSGGMFVQAERFVQTHGGRLGDIAITARSPITPPGVCAR
jgi:type I restriction enzyme M protein